MRIVIVTGLSGAGRSTTLRMLEDFGFYCVDNLPPQLVPRLIEILTSDEHIHWVALGIDVRTGPFLMGLDQVLEEMPTSGHHVETLFLDCRDEILLRRFSETRRPHRLAGAKGGDVAAAIAVEREQLAPIRAQSNYIVDSSDLTVHELRRTLADMIEQSGKGPQMAVRIVSFGYKYGLPTNADLVFDLRALPNPHFVPELRPQTGEHPKVRDFVLDTPQSQELLTDIETLLRHHMPHYEREGKAYLTVALGCTGGRHRSVAMSAELSKRLGQSRPISLAHRDKHRDDIG